MSVLIKGIFTLFFCLYLSGCVAPAGEKIEGTWRATEPGNNTVHTFTKDTWAISNGTMFNVTYSYEEGREIGIWIDGEFFARARITSKDKIWLSVAKLPVLTTFLERVPE